jgi:membrane-bound ClpP family serine protease
MVRTRRRLIVFMTGALLMVISVMLPSGAAFTVAFVSGLLVLGLSAPNALPWTDTTAMVGAWEWLHKAHADHR